jgi:L-threonylcarbamoyladenylate synthase
MTVLDVREDSEKGVAQAVSALRRGDLAVIPTDTVYGIAADAFSPPAVDRLLTAKGRGRDMPVPVLVGSWRGPLTLIVRAAGSLAWDLGETRGTVAVRMPLHPVALAVLAETGPLAVSSANRTGMPPATDAAQAYDQLGSAVAVYLEAGSSGEAVPSTIVDLTGETPVVRRAGALSVEDLQAVLPEVEGAN